MTPRHVVPLGLQIPVLLAAFVLQAVFPVGYMPGLFFSGLPLQLCPGGLPLAQDLDGPQLETDWSVTVGWQYTR